MKRLLALIVVVLVPSLLMAAQTPNSVVTCQTPNRGIVQFLQGTDSPGTYKTVYTAETTLGAASKIYGLWENNNDGGATHLVTCQVVNGGVKYGGVAVTTASNDGFANATPAKNLLSSANWPGLPVDQAGNPYLQLISGDTLQCTFATALTASDLINLVVTACDF